MIQNKGVYVRVIDVKDALDIYYIQAALERAGVLAASRRMRLAPRTPASPSGVPECLRGRGRPRELFRRQPRVSEVAGNERLLDLTERFSRESRLFRHVSLITAGTHESNLEHHRILEALEQAAAAMQEHVSRAKDRMTALAENLKGKQAP